MSRSPSPGSASARQALTLLDDLLERASRRIGGCSAATFLAAVIAVQVLLHLPLLSLPPMGQHTWRQVMWAAPARNYYEEGQPFLDPADDVRLAPDDQGTRYTEFPLLVWLLGQSYRVTGVNDVNGRAMMLAVGALLILGGYRLLKLLDYSEAQARWYVFFLAGSPYFFYWSIALEPNLPALAWFVWGLVFLLPDFRQGRATWRLWLGMALLLLATASKQTMLFFGLPVGFLLLYHARRTRRWGALWAASAALVLLLAVHALLYWHTLALYNASPPERQWYWEIAPAPPAPWRDLWWILFPPLATWIPELYVNSAATVFFLAGLWLALRQRPRHWERAGFWIAWMAAFAIFGTQFYIRFREHEYYLTPLLLITPAASALGADWLMARPRWRRLLVVFVVLVPIVMVGRDWARWHEARQVPDELLEHAADFQRLIPPQARVVVVGDHSPVIFLYFLHRKGVSYWRYPLTAEELQRLRGLGFRWAVTDQPPERTPALAQQGQVRGHVGTFTVLELPAP